MLGRLVAVVRVLDGRTTEGGIGCLVVSGREVGRWRCLDGSSRWRGFCTVGAVGENTTVVVVAVERSGRLLSLGCYRRDLEYGRSGRGFTVPVSSRKGMGLAEANEWGGRE